MKKIIFVILFLAIAAYLFYQYGRTIWHPATTKITGKKTVAEVIDLYGDQARQELEPLFNKKGISYPPSKLALVAFKEKDVLEVWASNGSGYQLITSYPIKAASGVPGPKLREGDKQVPEGIYKIIGFNPNSAYHLSMKLNYPNDFDLVHAKNEGRTYPGTNIFIHGRAASIGCLAMGDPAIEQLFSLVYATGKSNTTVLISPSDPSQSTLRPPADSPSWVSDLYKDIESKYSEITGK
ncbi:L,D-transpeptidase family protein [Microbulbifer agarilyticus]|uniref:L,D-transpeptidase family protein n=1 Tax=Microbulbifer agarilyticus TaxID=260552 RepID=UPI001C97B54D|nr:L,D-transpeptidase family protein [Microbulbifer agarilyticus]MBY6211899.1 L,D-transpeptidase family protein [Microbulbifer agarilyticus]